MNWREGQRRIAAARKREESAARRRIREIEAALRKSSAAAAELEVESHERVIENAVSIHKDAGDPFVWEDYLKVIDPYTLVVEDVIEASDDLTPARMRSLARRVLLGDLAGETEQNLGVGGNYPGVGQLE